MKKIFLAFLLFAPFVLRAKKVEDSLLLLLDDAIGQRSFFSEQRMLRIDSLNTHLLNTTDQQERFKFFTQIFNQYKHYNLDSALLVARRKNVLANQMGNAQRQYESQMNIAEMLGKMGMYKETFDILDEIGKAGLDKNQRGYYYHLNHAMYSLLLENALSTEERQHYQQLITSYKDSLLVVNDTNTVGYKLNYNSKLLQEGRLDEAFAFMPRNYNTLGISETERGAMAYGLSEVYEKKGQFQLQKKYLTIAALTDIRGAVKSYIALRKLAVLLFQEGDLERAYLYIRCCMEDATFCKARFRMIEISEALPIIVASYDKQMKAEKHTLSKYLLLISILSVVLLICIFFIYKQLHKLSVSEKWIKKANEKLTAINSELKHVNEKLLESDQVKETYIGYVFNLCSSYINKLENYRLELYKRLKAKQVEEVLKMTSSTSLATNELKEFFQNFDAVFLNIYPNFLEEFNKLLREEEQIIPKSGDILTSELRVFALMRLGISDSGKIAEFLHYSPQTVYNYTLKIKNKLAVSKEEFNTKIQQIGK
ncbi:MULTISPECIES: DUF6377 domain-containing protein [Chitinophagaceae]